MAYTVAQLETLTFGYLTGTDLVQFCAPQLLIKQTEVDINSLQRACNLAYAEIISNLTTRYDIKTELNKTGTARSLMCVRMVAILAVKYSLANFQNISDDLRQMIDGNKWDIINVRNGQINLPLNVAAANVVSDAILWDNSFQTLG
jgi:phage gp36-like protein